MLGVSPHPDGSFAVLLRPSWRGTRYRATVAGQNSGSTLAPDAQATLSGRLSHPPGVSRRVALSSPPRAAFGPPVAPLLPAFKVIRRLPDLAPIQKPNGPTQ